MEKGTVSAIALTLPERMVNSALYGPWPSDTRALLGSGGVTSRWFCTLPEIQAALGPLPARKLCHNSFVKRDRRDKG